MTYWKSEHFKALQKAWYQRLEEAGFQDAETVSGDDLVLKRSAIHSFSEADDYIREIKEAYYTILSHHVQIGEFRREIDQLILTWHSNGKKIKDICEELEKRGIRRCRNSVCFIIRRYEMQWGIKKYTPKQLNQPMRKAK